MGTKCAPLDADLFLFCLYGLFLTEIKLLLLRHSTLPQDM